MDNAYQKLNINGLPIIGDHCGFCHYNRHKGYLTLSDIKSHDCFGKGCSFLEINNMHPYWFTNEQNKLLKKYRKDVKKRYYEGNITYRYYQKLSKITNIRYIINYFNTSRLSQDMWSKILNKEDI